MNTRTEGSGSFASISQAIRHEIHRFESVHPVIYNLYDLIDSVQNPRLRNEIREHVINIEGKHHVNQELIFCNNVVGLSHSCEGVTVKC